MGLEIEKKFLVKKDQWEKVKREGVHIMQGYLSRDPGRVVRARVKGEKGFLTIKGKNKGAVRAEFEYEIPKSEAVEMIQNLCQQPIIDKHRYEVEFAGNTWEVDEFHAENEGLIIAEIELESENQPFEIPVWIGREVTEDVRFYNSNLIDYPFSKWNQDYDKL